MAQSIGQSKELAQLRREKASRKATLWALLLVTIAVTLVLALSAKPRPDAHSKASAKKPAKLLGGIYLPGEALRFDISWVDQATGRYYLAEAGNAAVDVVDAQNNYFSAALPGSMAEALRTTLAVPSKEWGRTAFW
jgi:hypothetical protein